jgi:hypothetical protein
MTARWYVIADVESAGLDPALHDPVEVGWWHFGTGEHAVFIPPHSLENADPEALQINNYHARNLGDETCWDTDGHALRRLHGALEGNWLVGFKPTFDASMLSPLFRKFGLTPEPWHYSSPFDLGLYGAGVLGRAPGGRFSMPRLCAELNVVQGDHTAMADVRASGQCLIELLSIVNARKAA